MLPVFVICCLTTSACHMGYALSMNLKLTTAKGFCFAYSCFVYMNCLFIYLFFLFNCKYLTISEQGWAKYSNLSVASRSIICQNRRLKQIIDLRDTDKSRYFVITKFNNCFIIRSLSLFFLMNILFICHFHARAIARRRKARFPFRMSRILFAAKYNWTALCMSRPLFVGSYLSANEKREEFASNDNWFYCCTYISLYFIGYQLAS